MTCNQRLYLLSRVIRAQSQLSARDFAQTLVISKNYNELNNSTSIYQEYKFYQVKVKSEIFPRPWSGKISRNPREARQSSAPKARLPFKQQLNLLRIPLNILNNRRRSNNSHSRRISNKHPRKTLRKLLPNSHIIISRSNHR